MVEQDGEGSWPHVKRRRLRIPSLGEEDATRKNDIDW